MTVGEAIAEGVAKINKDRQEELMAQIKAYVEQRREISQEVSKFLEEVNAGKCSTEHPVFFRGEKMDILINPEQQPNGTFRIAINLHPLPVGSFDLGFISLVFVTESGQRIYGRNRTAELREDDLNRKSPLHMLFENVPSGNFSLENWNKGR